jgi:hypothetical protein
VRDASGRKWKVKFGEEARPEIAASRIVWAAGYFADADYLVTNLRVEGMPARLRRGEKQIEPDRSILYARLKLAAKEEKAEGQWRWVENPFGGSRILSGLRTVMALLNNWDLKDENNSIRDENGERVYLVSDLGASFGTAGLIWPLRNAKGNLRAYESSKLVCGLNDESVDFCAPARPRFVFLVNPPEYVRRTHLEWIGKDIPRSDAHWIGKLLSGLSPQQLEDAFRAAGYSEAEGKAFAHALSGRIAALADL